MTTEEQITDKWKTNLIISADWVNSCAEDKDANRNHTNYGTATAYANILRDFGHKVDIAVWEDEGYLKIPKITIDGKTINMTSK